VIEDELGLSIPIAGLAKDDKHQTSQLLYGNPIEIIPLKRSSEGFYLLQRIQDEVHRFAITFHRQKRGTNSLASALDDIPGVGPKRKTQLLQHFGTVKKIREGSAAEFQKAGLPEKLAISVVQHFKEESAEEKS